MGEVTRTEAQQPWSRRLGGGYPRVEDAEMAAAYLEIDVMIGPPHPNHGYFMVPHPALPLREKEQHGRQ